jgi:hypothetical protein
MVLEMTFEERAAALLQCRMSWPLAERCAAHLAKAGLPNISEEQAVHVLAEHMPHERAVGAAQDLVGSGLARRGAR